MDTKDKERTRRTQGTKAGTSAKRRPEAGTKASPEKRRATGAQVSEQRKPATRKSEKSGQRKPAVQREEKSERSKKTARKASVGTDRRSATAARVKQTTAARRRRNRTAERKKPSIAQDVVYLPPKPFSRNRLLLRLASVVAVVLALVLGISVFFKVEAVIVYGNQKYSADDILEASGIETGDNLLTFSRAKAGGRIIGKLPFVENVRFGIKLPGTVNIEITEVEVGYATEDANGGWWLISAAGKVLEQLPKGADSGYTNIIGVKLNAPQVGSQAQALQEQTVQTDEAGNTIPVTVTAAKRLNTALNIVQYLEQNGIIGEAAYLDVSELGSIRLQYGQRYRVELGDDSQLSYKISCMKAAVNTLTKDEPYSTGMLDISNPEDISYKRDS